MTRAYPPRVETPQARQAFLRHYAGVLAAEAQARAGPPFAQSIAQWAAKAIADAERLAPARVQIEMFPAFQSQEGAR